MEIVNNIVLETCKKEVSLDEKLKNYIKSKLPDTYCKLSHDILKRTISISLYKPISWEARNAGDAWAEQVKNALPKLKVASGSFFMHDGNVVSKRQSGNYVFLVCLIYKYKASTN